MCSNKDEIRLTPISLHHSYGYTNFTRHQYFGPNLFLYTLFCDLDLKTADNLEKCKKENMRDDV